MTTTAEKYNASSGLVEPNSENEKQETTGNTLRQVLVNGRTFQIQSDRRSTFLGDKDLGFGMHVFKNGNIQMQAGPKTTGNGKFNIVSITGKYLFALFIYSIVFDCQYVFFSNSLSNLSQRLFEFTSTFSPAKSKYFLGKEFI